MKMASNVECVIKLQTEINHLENINNGIIRVKEDIAVGKKNMSHAGYNIMHIVHTWGKTEMVKMKNEKANLTDIDLI